ncbi:GHKL domain-containing protein [Lactobacillus sp. YT155]|uniref:sensor histidine kinase n=1 Tax=Lactobacillus sp. YT155 TaxID=3060955 RepID=UPI00265E4944|nr:GHKL domain-containing protein [Lactobacillus sp. YT155]MDO1604826.1 GHKL domain-containing protein [Lactobacillus sp. YT155]
MLIPEIKGMTIQLFTMILVFYIFAYFFDKNVNIMKRLVVSIVLGTIMSAIELVWNAARFEELMTITFTAIAFIWLVNFELKQPLLRYVKAIISGFAAYLIVKISVVLTELIIVYGYRFSGVGYFSDKVFTWGAAISSILSMYILSGLLFLLVNKVVKLMNSRFTMNRRLTYLFALLIVIAGVSTFSVDEAFRLTNASMRLAWVVVVTMLVMFAILSFAVWMFANATIKEQKFESEQENVRNLELYMSTLENNYNEVRKFRHDIKNALSALNYRINEYGDKELIDDVQDLLKEYNFNVMSDQRIDGLQYINNPFIKGLIFSKYLEAQTKGIQFDIEVSTKVLQEDEKYSDEFRILGIILDNAIEAAAETAQPRVTIGIENIEDGHSFLVVNTIKNSDEINLEDISQNGYSSKGPNRGLGLATVKEITDNSDNIFINYKIEDEKFIVNLSVDEGI